LGFMKRKATAILLSVSMAVSAALAIGNVYVK